MVSPKFLYRDMEMPKGVKVIEESKDDKTGIYEIEPLERGYGMTIGNSLRRMLLSSIPGTACFAVRLTTKSGLAPHEFATLKGIVTDTLDILMNIKDVRFKSENDQIITLSAELDAKKEAGMIKAKDFEPSDGSVEVTTPELVVAEVSEGGYLKIEMQVKNGRGYIPAENFAKTLETGWIAIDAIFSPVSRVKYYVEDTRVGQITDYDKLILEIETDGTISPRDAIGRAAKVIKDHMNPLINFEEEDKLLEDAVELTQEEKQLQKILQISVEELELSVRSYNCLKSANIRTLGELAIRSEGEMLKTRNFGRKSLNEIKEKLSQYNLELGMKGIGHLMAQLEAIEG